MRCLVVRAVLTATLVLALHANAQEYGLKVPPGFRVRLYADHTLANDIYTMTLDAKGAVLVSGRGYVRRLEDTNLDGVADRAVDLVPTKTGAMGLLVDPFHMDRSSTLYVTADGQLTVYRGPQADGTFAKIYHNGRAMPFSEHGGHVTKFGPDGYIYAIAGNDGRLNEGTFAKTSPLPKAEGGGIFRFRKDHPAGAELVAAGFRNPYDFDFTPHGDLITYDSDTERDFLLPWYMPTRAYHVQVGQNHGWRLPGYLRSLAKRDDYPDTVPLLADMARGSPTGVCCYRHTQFPTHYRGGVFLMDWTFGKVYYLPLVPEGSSYRSAKPEVFMEATGNNGFAPTAARVAPDGSLYVSMGGRGTRGAVYKIEYVGTGTAPAELVQPKNILEAVLDAPQPLEAWSLARWYPLALKLDQDELRHVYANDKESDARRVRAIEILVARQLPLDSTPPRQLEKGLASTSHFVRARLAWALRYQRVSVEERRLLKKLASDADARVRANALETLWLLGRHDNAEPLTAPHDTKLVLDAMDAPDRRIRLHAGRLLEHADADLHTALVASLRKEGTTRQIVVYSLANLGKQAPPENVHWELLQVADERAKNAAERVDVLRAITVFLGDWRLHEPTLELYAAYALAGSNSSTAMKRLQYGDFANRLAKRFPTADERENHETARLLALLAADESALVGKLLARITATSHPTEDFHYLIVLSLLRADSTPDETQRMAGALLGLERKLAGRQLRIKQNWSVRFGELAGQLMQKYKGLAEQISTHLDLVAAGHVAVAQQLPMSLKPKAAERFFAVVQKDGDFPLSPELVRLLAMLPKGTYRPLFRDRWTEYAAREAIVRILATDPQEVDRPRFHTLLENGSAELTTAMLTALRQLPKDPTAEGITPVLQRLQGSLAEPKEAPLRKELLAFLEQQTGHAFGVTEGKTDRAALQASYQPVFAWFEKTHPVAAKKLLLASDDLANILKQLPTVNWEAGNRERGAKIYKDRGCLACHTGGSRIGPDLSGVSKRFAQADLFTSIVAPSRDVAPAFRLTNFDRKRGPRVSGIVIFESADGYIVQANATDTVRLATEELESIAPSTKSLMPDGLLKDLKPEDWADLYAYLREL